MSKIQLQYRLIHNSMWNSRYTLPQKDEGVLKTIKQGLNEAYNNGIEDSLEKVKQYHNRELEEEINNLKIKI